jgi:hypothetical protein
MSPKRKVLNLMMAVLTITGLIVAVVGPVVAQPLAMPSGPTDQTTVPHYFGPWPNWANSPFTLPNATVEIVSTGAGSGATAVAVVDPMTQGIASIEITSPGKGYTPGTTSVVINGGTPGGATATATVNTSGVVSSIVVDLSGGGYTSPQVSFSGGGGTATPVDVGNALNDRTYATDFPAAPLPRPVFVVVPTPLPAGILTDFLSWNQATPGGSPTPSEGEQFSAYVLRPTGVANEYDVVFASPMFTVPAVQTPGVSELLTWPVGNVAVQAGDVLGFYGSGIPLDVGVGADLAASPVSAAPVPGVPFTLGSAGFPFTGDLREYSFGARVLDSSAVPPVVQATGIAYGGVDVVAISDGGWGYTMPTVDFDLPDAPDGVIARAHIATVALDGFDGMDANGTILPNGVIVDEPGSGYVTAPGVAIHNGTLFDPISLNPGGSLAAATTTLKVTSVTMDSFGSGYVSAPMVTFSDVIGGAGAGASATAFVDFGTVTGVTVTNAGSGYLTVGMRKFIDDLPGLCVPPACPASGKYIPVAVPEAKTYNGVQADEFAIGLVQYRTSFSSDLPPTLVRGYVQLETPANVAVSQHFPLTNEMLDGTQVPVLINGVQALGVTPPQYLGPVIAATKNKPVRIVFRNLLPTGAAGDLFLPVDATMMGSGMGPMEMMPPMNMSTVMDEVRNPMCGEYPKGMGCFKDNRATLHLHGGTTPWISDGTAHQWTTQPAR